MLARFFLQHLQPPPVGGFFMVAGMVYPIPMQNSALSSFVYTSVGHLRHNPCMKKLIISPKVLEKLSNKHHVERREVEQCFENIAGNLLQDDREDHRTEPPTMWFLARTNKNRLLKVVYIQKGEEVTLRTCYEPNEIEIGIYRKYANWIEE